MADSACGHCATPMRDRSTLVQERGKAFCCPNCARAADDSAFTPGAEGICAHCGTIVVEQATVVERDGMIFCCNNCAQAMAVDDQPTSPTY